jgi:hypothetical protein
MQEACRQDGLEVPSASVKNLKPLKEKVMPKKPQISSREARSARQIFGFRVKLSKRGKRESYGEVCASPAILKGPDGKACGWITRENHGGVMVVLMDTRTLSRMVVGLEQEEVLELPMADLLRGLD